MTAAPGAGSDRAATREDTGDPNGSPDRLTTLLDRAARGDTAAFERVYDQTAGAVFGIATRVLRNRAIAEEVAQDVMVEIWRTSSRYNPRLGAPKTWILTIAHARAVDRVRHEQSATSREKRVATLDVRRPYDDVSERAESNLETEQVRRFLAELTECQRDAVRLAYYDGYTYPEVARLLGTPLGTAKTRMGGAVSKLRECMAVTR